MLCYNSEKLLHNDVGSLIKNALIILNGMMLMGYCIEYIQTFCYDVLCDIHSLEDIRLYNKYISESQMTYKNDLVTFHI